MSSPSLGKSALEGLRVVEWSAGDLATRFAARVLADFGADVLVAEHDEAADDLSTLALAAVLREQRLATTLVGMKQRSEVDRNLRALATPVDEALLADVKKVLEPVKDRTWPSGKF